ncbi:TPA: hypothetical protein ACG4ML_000406 [Stenotrophomonas maltophilia]|uniref:hypothetical protein n=1 Tax=Stenotrophomonas maltophilia TaxID=40324 RepID=UPI001132198D|nr:hypothetical protein [Stenotrophomonas maltophilia]HDS1367020.1 hypothetical protein [Stenotrophomonas maltophilia]HDS1371824.1 hypothetical protein [Stenotrophomonas maltophilia]HDS1376420.1 hypothetical protein [Stenotrophomonas maltophilia]HDS1381274.1 hypothetical protein [Stenotrophomonas maltophilia]HDS1386048.1 hypothetical protein [Stenotrophomonas maltophilia]
MTASAHGDLVLYEGGWMERSKTKMEEFALAFLRATKEKKTLKIDGGSISIDIADVEHKIRKLRAASKVKADRPG